MLALLIVLFVVWLGLIAVGLLVKTLAWLIAVGVILAALTALAGVARHAAR